MPDLVVFFGSKAGVDLDVDVEGDSELRENHLFLLGNSVPLRVVAVETVECVEAASLDAVLEEVRLVILGWILVDTVFIKELDGMYSVVECCWSDEVDEG